jgi:hypothetical protein
LRQSHYFLSEAPVYDGNTDRRAIMSHRRRQFLQLAVGAVALPFLGRAATADESYPSPPGTAADITARAFGNGASDLLGQQIVVEDKPGAGSSVAAEYVARAAKDGYTLFLSSLSIVTSQIINPDPAFDLDKDFAPVSLLASGAVVLVVSPQSNLSSVADLIALAKSKPDQVLCANAGIGRRTVCPTSRNQIGTRALSRQPASRDRPRRRTCYNVLLPRFHRDRTDHSRQTQSACDGGK